MYVQGLESTITPAAHQHVHVRTYVLRLSILVYEDCTYENEEEYYRSPPQVYEVTTKECEEKTKKRREMYCAVRATMHSGRRYIILAALAAAYHASTPGPGRPGRACHRRSRKTKRCTHRRAHDTRGTPVPRSSTCTAVRPSLQRCTHARTHTHVGSFSALQWIQRLAVRWR